MWQVHRTLGSSIATFKIAPYSEKVRCVCGDCNRHWMSDLETDASQHLKPMIRGEKARLNEGAQALVATWAALRAAVLDQAHGGAGVPRAHHQALYAHRQRGERRPPQGSWIRLAAYQNPGQEPPAYHGTRLHATRPAERLPPSNTNGYAATFTIGYLMCHVIGFEGAIEDRTPRDSRRLMRVATRIWPSFPTRCWPPPATLSPGGVKAFADMWP
jgi:hypothetical protein